MKTNSTLSLIRVSSLCGAILLSAGLAESKTHRRHKARPELPPEPVESISPVSKDTSIRLLMSDGARVTVAEAWESEQGIWYVQSGVSHLVSRDRVKAIERGPLPTSPVKGQRQIAKATAMAPSQTNSWDKPVWIYLIGGARVEADSATEAPAGVWYKRGPLAIFVERARIDHVKSEELETVAESDSSSHKERGWSTGRPKIDVLIRQSGAKFGVDPYLIFCVMEQESHFNTRAESPKGARGLMQLMPGTGARFGVRRPFDPGQNIAGGTRYLKQLLERFSNRVDLVLASYNAGEGAVVRFGHRVPPYRETRDYVRKISYRYRQVKVPLSPPQRPAQRSVVAAGGI
ncbi:MAG: lytic transglycosylase domain-containing protein [Acidobacteriota bacterium]